MEQSLVSQIKMIEVLRSGTYTSKTDGEVLDSVNFQSMTFLLSCQTYNADITIKVQHSDDNATFVDTQEGDIIYAQDLIFTDVGLKQVGYIGKKRYVRASFESGDGEFSIFGILGHPERVPTVGERASKQFPDYPYSI